MIERQAQHLSLEAVMEPGNANPSEEVAAHTARLAKILLVDEDTKDRDNYLLLLRSRGFEVCACPSYEQAAKFIDHEDFDFVIVDQGSPAFEGHYVVQRALQLGRRKPVLVLTRYHNMNCYCEAMQLGALDYLEKPLSGPDIIGVVERHIPLRIAAA
jgi:two-component system, OmpR family, phosphate regulon response regulator OmpR